MAAGARARNARNALYNDPTGPSLGALAAFSFVRGVKGRNPHHRQARHGVAVRADGLARMRAALQRAGLSGRGGGEGEGGEHRGG